MIVGGVIVAPFLINGVVVLGKLAVAGGRHLFNKHMWEREMRKQIKEGKVVKINGEYYNVVDITEEV